MSTAGIRRDDACPGRSAARSGALQTRDRYKLRVWNGPGSAVHRSASLRAAPHPGNYSLIAVIALGRRGRDVALRDVALKRRAVALFGVAVAAAAGALQQEAFAGAQFVAARGRRFALALGAQ